MVGTDRASGSGLDLQGYARYQNRSSVSHTELNFTMLSYFAAHPSIVCLLHCLFQLVNVQI